METKKSFDETWEKIHSEMSWGAYPPEYLIRFIARNFYKKNRPEIKILDFGCGAGACAWYLAREGFCVHGFDGSKSAIERAKQRLMQDGNLKAELRVMDGVNLDYQDEFFDCVVDSACIYANKLEDIRLMYEQVYRVLKNQGRIFSSCFGKRTAGYKTGVELEKDTFSDLTEGVLANRAIAHFYNKEELEACLKEAGFKNIIVDTMFYTDNGIDVEMLVAKAEK